MSEEPQSYRSAWSDIAPSEEPKTPKREWKRRTWKAVHEFHRTMFGIWSIGFGAWMIASAFAFVLWSPAAMPYLMRCLVVLCVLVGTWLPGFIERVDSEPIEASYLRELYHRLHEPLGHFRRLELVREIQGLEEWLKENGEPRD